jgi:hypothetical protein
MKTATALFLLVLPALAASSSTRGFVPSDAVEERQLRPNGKGSYGKGSYGKGSDGEGKGKGSVRN